MNLILKSGAPSRSVTDVGPGDYVKVKGRWKRIESNSAEGQIRAPRSWAIRTEGGEHFGMYDIDRYALADDLERPIRQSNC